jgi:hypothetical protein
MLSASKRKSAPVTAVSLFPPKGFKVTTNIPGFISIEDKSSIIVTHLPIAPYKEVSAYFTKAQLTTKKIELLTFEEIFVFGYPSILAKVRKLTFLKWILVFSDETFTPVAMVTFPEIVAEKLSESLRVSILSIEKTAIIQEQDIDFIVEARGNLNPLAKISNSILFSDSPVFPIKGDDHAIFIAAPSFTKKFSGRL